MKRSQKLIYKHLSNIERPRLMTTLGIQFCYQMTVYTAQFSSIDMIKLIYRHKKNKNKKPSLQINKQLEMRTSFSVGPKVLIDPLHS